MAVGTVGSFVGMVVSICFGSYIGISVGISVCMFVGKLGWLILYVDMAAGVFVGMFASDGSFIDTAEGIFVGSFVGIVVGIDEIVSSVPTNATRRN